MIVREIPRDALVDKVNVKKYTTNNINKRIVFKKKDESSKLDDTIHSYDVIVDDSLIGNFNNLQLGENQFGCCLHNNLYIIYLDINMITVYKNGDQKSIIKMYSLDKKLGNSFECEEDIDYIIISIFLNEMLYTWYKVPDHLPRVIEITGG